MSAHHESHAYGYAVALLSRRWLPDNLAAYRAKCAKYHKPIELDVIDAQPLEYMRHGFRMAAHKANRAKSAGQLAYEADKAAKPAYDTGHARPHWDALGAPQQGTWHRNPTHRGAA